MDELERIEKEDSETGDIEVNESDFVDETEGETLRQVVNL